jgi:hypothetical protein
MTSFGVFSKFSSSFISCRTWLARCFVDLITSKRLNSKMDFLNVYRQSAFLSEYSDASVVTNASEFFLSRMCLLMFILALCCCKCFITSIPATIIVSLVGVGKCEMPRKVIIPAKGLLTYWAYERSFSSVRSLVFC